jgi:hypothetical protein
MIAALRTLSSISRLWSRLQVGAEQANFLVVNLCKYVSSQSVPASRFPGKDTKDIEELVAQSFQCISDWVLVDQWIFSYPETRDDLLASLVIGLTGKKVGSRLWQCALHADPLFLCLTHAYCYQIPIDDCASSARAKCRKEGCQRSKEAQEACTRAKGQA